MIKVPLWLLLIGSGEAFLTRHQHSSVLSKAQQHVGPRSFQNSQKSSSSSNGAPPYPTRKITTTFEWSAYSSSSPESSSSSRLQMNLEVPEDLSSFNSSQLKANFDSVRSNVLDGEWGTRGELYFGVQVVIGLCILIGSIPVIGGFVNLLVGPGLLLSGLTVAALAANGLGPTLSPWPVPTDSTQLLTTGLYGQMRHPIYTGLLASCTGFSIVTDSALRMLLTLGLLYLLNLKVDYEEAAMVDKFGAEYETYREQVPTRFVPKALLNALPWTRATTSRYDDEDANGFQ